MDHQYVNLDAQEDALRLLGGDNLVAMFNAVYEAVNKAEERGQLDGFSAGHDIGQRDAAVIAEMERKQAAEAAAEQAPTEAEVAALERELAELERETADMEQKLHQWQDAQPSSEALGALVDKA